MKTAGSILGALFAFTLSTPSAGRDLRVICTGPAKTHTEVIDAGRHTYSVRMGGRIDGEMTRDPVGYTAYDQFWEPNVFVRMENIGDVPVVNPWLQRAGRPDTRSVRSIVDGIVKPSMPDWEKARRLWEFEIKQRFHATTNDEAVDDAVKRFNCYGYTLCGNESKVMSDLWRAAGLRTRRGFPSGHSTAEAFYDGAWHLLDSDENIICLLRDNKTIASEAQIVSDHDLMKRTHTYGVLHDDDRLRSEGSASAHHYEGERKGEQPSRTSHTMDYVLRPGEAITWAWNPLNRHHGMAYPDGGSTEAAVQRWGLLHKVMDGELTYSPDLTRQDTLKYIQTDGVELRQKSVFGAGLYLTGRSGAFVIPVKSAYPIVGGRLEMDFARRNVNAERLKVSASFDQGKTWRQLWTSSYGEFRRMYLDLNPLFPLLEPERYEYLLRVELLSDAEQPLVSVKSFYLKSTLQMARLALPGLSLGDNPFTYTDESGPGRKVRITHSWSECDDAEVPGAPGEPEVSAAADGRIAFRWAPPAQGTPPADYELQVSEYADMRWVLSPNFHKLIERTANRGTTAYQLPYKGLLNPGETYYWRVRARSSEGVWGPWSKVASFSPQGPAVPLDVAARFDPATRKATLKWAPGKGGVAPARYRIYGSSERGFSAYDVPYTYAGAGGTKDSPPNLLVETRSATTSIELTAALWRAFYRVAAVDGAGRESGPSDMAELSHPLLESARLPEGKASTYYSAPLEISVSTGHLTSLNGRRFRTGDELVFDLAGAPRGLSIFETGLLAGYLPPDSEGTYQLQITVSDKRTGARDSLTLPLTVKK